MPSPSTFMQLCRTAEIKVLTGLSINLGLAGANGLTELYIGRTWLAELGWQTPIGQTLLADLGLNTWLIEEGVQIKKFPRYFSEFGRMPVIYFHICCHYDLYIMQSLLVT